MFAQRMGMGHKKEAKIPMRYVVTKSGRRIVTAQFLKPGARQIIIYSHGNSEDLGVDAKIGLLLSTDLDVSVICYDYSGYGHSEGTPSEENCYEDISAVYDHVTNDLGYRPCDVILMGWSLGSGPTVHLASQLSIEYKKISKEGARCRERSKGISIIGEDSSINGGQKPLPLGGVILCSAFTSILAIVNKAQMLHCMDTFNNLEKMSSIIAPVLIIHGTIDEIISVKHGRQLYEKSRNAVKPMYIIGANHEDIYIDPFRNEVKEAIVHLLETCAMQH